MADETTFRALPSWTLVTSHGLVLLYVSAHPSATIRQVAESLELTERRVTDVIRELAGANLLDVKRIGRRNHYSLRPDARFRHPLIAGVSFESFVSLWRDSRAGGLDGGQPEPAGQVDGA